MSNRCLDELGKVLFSGYIGEGPKVKEFEKLLSDYLGGYVALVNSGTSALHLALHIAGVNGANVVSTPMTCLATNTPILQNGGRVVWADVDPQTGNMTPEYLAASFTDDTRAVMAVHYGGNLCDPSLLELCRRAGVPLIEDCAHLTGPGLGGIQCYSYQAIKQLTTVDGGALVTQDKAIHQRAKLLRWYGIDREAGQTMQVLEPVHEAGYKFHMNDVSAAIGIANMSELDGVVARTQRHATVYNTAFADLRHVKTVPVWFRNDYWLYILLVEEKERFAATLTAQGIETSPVHGRNDIHPIFAASRRALPGLEAFWERQICIPVGWWLTDEDVSFIADSVKRFDASFDS